MDFTVHQEVLIAGFLIAVVMGAFVNKTNFCTMGAVSDWVNIGDTGRLRSWLFAIAISIAGVIVFEVTGIVDLETMRPPYRTANFEWLRYILGGILFGIGMTLGSGCGNKTLVRVGGGNIKSVVVLVVAAIFAYLMTKTDFYGIVFYSWMSPIAIDLSAMEFAGQDLGSLLVAAVASGDVVDMRLYAGGVLVTILMFVVWKSADFRQNIDNVLGGVVVGGCVLGAWYVTGGALGQIWIEDSSFLDEIPIGIGAQSYSFINPMGETLDVAMHPTNNLLLTFGVMGLLGVITGSFLYSVLTRKFRIEWFSSLSDFFSHIVGAALMGIGGILSMGCTIGQGITGFSTLAVGSMMAYASFIFGSALTMKIQYYKMVYEEEATFMGAFVSALVDMRLLPTGMRKLDAI
ncbi:MAG: YeeE/YedE family protein [Gammaproteobacteria bacterium]|nr:YeeE/YedE family protein [Gammaproteobacteria bacterium]